MIAAAASTRLIASTASVTIMSDPPAPPKSSGTSIPMRPSANNCGMSAGSSRPARSIAWTRGRTSSSANSVTAERNMTSSSVSDVNAAGRSGAVSVAMDWKLIERGKRGPRASPVGGLPARGERPDVSRAGCGLPHPALIDSLSSSVQLPVPHMALSGPVHGLDTRVDAIFEGDERRGRERGANLMSHGLDLVAGPQGRDGGGRFGQAGGVRVAQRRIAGSLELGEQVRENVLGHGGMPPAGFADVGFALVHDLAVLVERQLVLGALSVAPGSFESDDGRGSGGRGGSRLRPAAVSGLARGALRRRSGDQDAGRGQPAACGYPTECA